MKSILCLCMLMVVGSSQATFTNRLPYNNPGPYRGCIASLWDRLRGQMWCLSCPAICTSTAHCTGVAAQSTCNPRTATPAPTLATACRAPDGTIGTGTANTPSPCNNAAAGTTCNYATCATTPACPALTAPAVYC